MDDLTNWQHVLPKLSLLGQGLLLRLPWMEIVGLGWVKRETAFPTSRGTCSDTFVVKTKRNKTVKSSLDHSAGIVMCSKVWKHSHIHRLNTVVISSRELATFSHTRYLCVLNIIPVGGLRVFLFCYI